MKSERYFITDNVFDASQICSYMSFLIASGLKGEKNEYIKLSLELDDNYSLMAEERITQAYEGKRLQTGNQKLQFPDVRAAGYDIAFGILTVSKGMKTHIDAIKRVDPPSGRREFYYEPMLFIRNPHITRIHRISLAYRAMVLGHAQRRVPKRGMIIYGPRFSHSRIDLTPHFPKAASLIDSLNQIIYNKVTPALFLNRNCTTCQFESHCRNLAESTDDLSLLSGISKKEVSRQNGKGIFTVNQLSYTFRSRRPPKRSKTRPPLHSYALQALSLRENKIHIHGDPKLTTTSKSLYLDIEGIPDRNFYYLIGLLEIGPNGKEKYHYFWADDFDDQNSQFIKYFKTMGRQDDYTLYHYGHYEKQALKQIGSNLDETFTKVYLHIEECLTNVLSIIHSHIYFPSLSNSLKEIAPLLGFRWQGSNNSGLNSIVWRTQWEKTHDPKLKARLLDYNHDDCRALRCVVDFLRLILNVNATDEDGDGFKYSVEHTADLRSSYSLRPKFGKINFAFDELELVNSCAYFDYQRDKVFVRTNDRVKKIKKRIASRKKTTQRIKANSSVVLHCGRCIKCRNNRIIEGRKTSRTIIDLKFINFGIKKWITTYIASWYECKKCEIKFTHPDLPVKHTKWGGNLINWCVYQNIIGGQNMRKVRRGLKDLFGISLPNVTYRFKSLVAKRLQPIAEDILNEIVSGPLIHVDETQVRLWKDKGYVWVFANMDSVYFLYRESRKAEFLGEMLAGFSGVLVSDFFSGYDALPCHQQKCLIHLIRDMNHDLNECPFDKELKDILHDFARVMQDIVETIDKYGLKHRNLRKHQRQTSKFTESVKKKEYSSEKARKYQKRIVKYEGRLFSFLNFDGIPWNNNVAEHSIKSFAKYRRLADGNYTQRSISEYLTILSVLQTCEYRGFDTLKFLTSGEGQLPC